MDKVSKKIEWIEILRCFACISLVVFHVIRHFSSAYTNLNSALKIFNIVILGIFNNIGVSCFIMISGYLLLAPSKNISPF